MGSVTRKTSTAKDKLVARLRRFGVATLHEAMGQSGLMDPGIRARQNGPAVAGRALTAATTAGDNWALHIALEQCSPGDMLVVAATPPEPFGYFGDIMAGAARARGCTGLVIDGGVRDTRALRRMGFSVWARHVCARGTCKALAGPVNGAITCGGVVVNPGDIVVADEDGVVVLPVADAESIAIRAAERARMERRMRKAIKAGQSTLSFLGLSGAAPHTDN